MNFNEKLQELRKKKGLTQEELAKSLYVSRTAISKWESGKGYPSIDSIKDIAKFFDVTIDQLLSSNQLLLVAENDTRQTKKCFFDLIFGLLDLSIALLFLLPFFAVKSSSSIENVSLISLYSVQPYIKIAYYISVILTIITGVLFLSLQNFTFIAWTKSKIFISLILSAILVMLFIISLQPYASIFVFVLLTIKALILIKHKWH